LTGEPPLIISTTLIVNGRRKPNQFTIILVTITANSYKPKLRVTITNTFKSNPRVYKTNR